MAYKSKKSTASTSVKKPVEKPKEEPKKTAPAGPPKKPITDRVSGWKKVKK